MTKPTRKLNLTRETLHPLQNAPLEGVAGGATPSAVSASVVIASMRTCIPASRLISAASVPVANSVSKAWNWLKDR